MTSELEPTPADAGESLPIVECAGAPGAAPENPVGVAEPPAAAPDTGTGPATEAEAASSPGPVEAAPMTGRRKALLVLLTSVFAVFVVFTGWYLLNRKPITQLPLPVITVEQVPHYAFSVYGVSAPTGVAVSPDGSRIYVTQTEQDAKVLVFDRGGRLLATVTPPSATGSQHAPVYVALNPTSGDLYVTDRPTGSIYVFSSDGVYRRTFDPGPTLVGWQPLGLSFDQRGDLFVTDVSGPYHRVHEFDQDGKLVRTIGTAGLLNFPNGVAVDGRGYIYVSDSNNGRLVVFDASGQQASVIRRGSAEGDLGIPRGTAVDGDGRVYVVDTMAQGVQVYQAYEAGERAPRFIGRFGVEGTADGGFEYPNGVAVDARGRVYVTDWRNNRVQVWSW